MTRTPAISHLFMAGSTVCTTDLYGCSRTAHALAFSHALAGASHVEGGLGAFAHCWFPLGVRVCSLLLGDGRRLEHYRLGRAVYSLRTRRIVGWRLGAQQSSRRKQRLGTQTRTSRRAAKLTEKEGEPPAKLAKHASGGINANSPGSDSAPPNAAAAAQCDMGDVAAADARWAASCGCRA